MIAKETRESSFGLGVFSCQKVHKGDAVWWLDDENCSRLNENNIKLVEDERLSNVLWKGYLNPTMDKVNKKKSKVVEHRHEMLHFL